MSSGDIERQIAFIIEQQANFSTDIEQLKEVQKLQAANIDRLTSDVQMLTGAVANMREQMDADRQEAREVIDRLVSEMHEGFNKLIASDQKTTSLMTEIGLLAVNNSKRITKLESERGSE